MPLSPLGDLGPVIVSWGGTDLSTHFGTCNFRHSETNADVREALHGQASVDAIHTGNGPCEFDIPCTRMTYAQLAAVLPGGSQSGGESGNVLDFNNKIGRSMYENAAELIVKRIVDGIADTDRSKWLHIPKSYPVPMFDVPFDLDTQRAFLVTFKGFPDATTKLSWHIGDH